MNFTESLIQKHEGLRLKVYKDSLGIATIGYGFNLEAAGARALCAEFNLDHDCLISGGCQLAEFQAVLVFEAQMKEVYAVATKIFPDYHQMPQSVQAVIADLIFNLGETRFSKFVSTIAQLKAGNWKQAANDLTSSLWFHQVGHRATEDVALLRSA
jgi:lysozyme